MGKQDLATMLRALATDDQHRSETARLRDVYEDIEAALQAGVSRVAILESLRDQGFTMNLKGFDNALYRIRKKRKNQNSKRQESTEEPEVKNSTESKGKTTAPAEDKRRAGKFDIPVTKRFVHNPTPDDDLLE